MTMMASAPAMVRAKSSVVPVLPESAPFSAAQRAWLNGFFAGLLGNQTSVAEVPSAEAAPAPAEVEEDFPWHDPTLSLAERLKLAEGKPHERQLMSAMAQLDCGACGYLCQTYAEAIAAVEEKDLTRCVPGGRETAKALKQIRAAAPANVVPVSEVRVKKAAAPADTNAAPADTNAAPATWDRNNPYSARLLESRPLNGTDSAKDTRLVVIDLKENGPQYKPGDALGIYPENWPTLVTELLEALA